MSFISLQSPPSTKISPPNRFLGLRFPNLSKEISAQAGMKCWLWPKMAFKSKFKLIALVGIAICVLSLLVHLLLVNYSTGDFIPYKLRADDFYLTEKIHRYGKLWGPVNFWQSLQPYANPRSTYPVPNKSNGFIYVKIYGGFDKIRSSICDVVAISRLLNATLVIPEIQESLRSKGVSSKFKSFSYLYNEEQFIAALSNDVVVVKSLPDDLKEDRKKNKFPVLSLKHSASHSFYIREILPKLKKTKVLGFVIAEGGCLEVVTEPNDVFKDGDSSTRLDLQNVNSDESPIHINSHSLIRDVEEIVNIPQIGMEFSSVDAAYEFYNHYALKTGFGVRRSSSHKSRIVPDKVIAKQFVCNKYGKCKTNENTLKEGIEIVRRRPTLVGCLARMKVVLTDHGTWKVTLFVEHHNNHDLTTPSKTAKHRSHKRLHRLPLVKDLMTDLHNEGLRNTHIASVINVIGCSTNEVMTSQQVHDQLRIERKNNIGRNCIKIIRHFKEKKANDLDFYFNFQVEDDGTMRSVFWADGRSRISYSKFKDVIVFDVTYRTNNFNLPFAPFTGINHHRQSTLFGCALLADETEDTFVWLFQQWLRCMGGVIPGAIITDQDAAIGNAIARVFPNSRHRFCDWHLDKNISDNLIRETRQHGEEFRIYFNQLKASKSIQEAEQCWEEMKKMYIMGQREWLPKLWDRRHSWIPCYVNDVFLAGSRTSQRAESLNAFFDGFVHASTPLSEFVIQYDRALDSRRRAEEEEDFKTMNSNGRLFSEWPVENQAGKLYTRVLFQIFIQEVKDGCLNYRHKKLSKEGTSTKYIVGRMGTEECTWKIVNYDSNNHLVSCECKMFEHTGILCRHVLNILRKKYVVEIPDRYILKRWTIESRHRNIARDKNVVQSTDTIVVGGSKWWEIRSLCNIVLEEACHSNSFYLGFHTYLSSKIREIEHEKKSAQVNQLPTTSLDIDKQEYLSTPSISNLEPNIEYTIHDPIEPKGHKGRPKIAKRLQSGLEQSQNERAKKQRTCSFCKAKGHYFTGCPQAKSVLPPSMAEYQRLRCRVAFHALQFRPEVRGLGNLMVERLRAFGRPYLAYHPGLLRDTLAFHGCAELFQDVHSELIQHKRRQMVKRGIVHGNLSIDSAAQKRNGSCPLMPEEVGVLLRALGYPPNTIIYLAGAETFGGQRVLIPLRAMYPNTLDRTSLCHEKELSKILGPESPLSPNHSKLPPVKSEKQLIEVWKKAGPRPRPLPPPRPRPFYQHEKEGWYGWVAETDKEPDPSLLDLRIQAHRLLWNALDYYVSVEADGFFPGFHNDGSGWPDFSSLVMGHRLYQMASGITYRPDRKTLAEIFETIRDHLYNPKRNWTALVRDHLNKSLGIDGFISEALMSKPMSFLSHPLPECSCRASKPQEIPTPVKGPTGDCLFGGEDQCPEWMVRGLSMVLTKSSNGRDEGVDEKEPPEDYTDSEGQMDSNEDIRTDASRLSEQDEEMDPDD